MRLSNGILLKIKVLVVMEKKLYACVENAIRAVGIANFKKTSMFLSNESAAKAVKNAA